MSARERRLLEKLGFWGDQRALPAAELAERTGFTVPTTLGALQALQRRGFVRYFTGHPGVWAPTARGQRELKA